MILKLLMFSSSCRISEERQNNNRRTSKKYLETRHQENFKRRSGETQKNFKKASRQWQELIAGGSWLGCFAASDSPWLCLEKKLFVVFLEEICRQKLEF